MTATLRRVLVRPPQRGAADNWQSYGWHAKPDPLELAREHEQLCELLDGAGAEVIAARSTDAGNLDAIYVYDPVLVCDRGAILLRPGKEARRREPDTLESDLSAAGVPTLTRLAEPATAEGGDTVWLDARTLLVGHGYRTNAAGINALRAALPDVEVIPVDLPHFRGPEAVLHLMSLISPLDRNLAAVYLPLMPVRMVELLRERDISLVEVPDDEFESMGPNVLALGPRFALALEGNAVTRRRMEHAGVEVIVYKGDEISRKGDGGPTCLTRPLLRNEQERAE